MAVAIALLAVTAAVTIHRRSRLLRVDMRAARANVHVARDRVPRLSERLRTWLDRQRGSAARRSADMAAVDRRLDGSLASLGRGRVAIEQLHDRRLLPLGRLVQLIATVARYAALWRNPLG